MSAEELFQQGKNFINEYDTESAIQCLEQALSLAGSQVVPGLSFTLADLYQNLGQMDRAKELFYLSIQQEPAGNTQKYMQVAQMEQGLAAKALYEQGITYGTQELQGMHVSTDEYRILKRQLAQAYAAIAELYMTDLCDETDAQQTCEGLIQSAINTDDLWLDGYQSMANYSLITGQMEKATEAVEKMKVVLRNVGENHMPTSETLGEIIRVMVEIKDWEGVVNLAKQSLALNERQPDIVYIYAFALFNQQEYDDANEILEVLLKMPLEPEISMAAQELEAELRKVS